ncbi:MAG: S41 family peptidase [Anaerolineales bacterium]|jgi:carboxyl-terminal processing protease
MQSKSKIWVIGITVGLVLTSCVFVVGILYGVVIGRLGTGGVLSGFETQLLGESTPQPTFDENPPDNSEELFAPFWQAWNIIHDEYVDQPVDDVKLMRGAIEGALNALGDEHTAYMDPATYTQANIPLQGSYEGIGAWVDTEAEFLTIVSPMPSSPAEEAGLEPGDQVIAVDGEDVTGVDASIVVRQVLGPAGTDVTLTIRRESEDRVFDVTITRREITIPSVASEMLDGDIAYIQIFSFSNDTSEKLREAIKNLLSQDPSGMVLDLRGNGGGYLFSAIDVASEFIDQGLIMTERFGDGTEETYDANGNGLATEIPLIVLIDQGTASASEIVAGAIQDYGRGTLVGETSFGKGSVQNWIPLEGDGGAVRVTIARWYTPDGHQIHGIGLEPDVLVPFTEEDIAEDRDPQLDAAISILRQKTPVTSQLVPELMEAE